VATVTPKTFYEEPQTKRREHWGTRYGDIARYAVAEYLRWCLVDPNVRGFVDKFSPYSEYWVVREDEQQADPDYPDRQDNPLEQPINIGRYFERSKEKPPQLLVRDQGFQNSNTNLGGLSWGFNRGSGEQQIGVLNDVAVTVEITAAAMDVTQTSLLVDYANLVLGPLGQRLLNGGVLYSARVDDRGWAVFLPISNASVSGFSDLPLGEDRSKRVWTRTLSLETRVESIVQARYERHITVTGPLRSLFPDIRVDTTLRVGQKAQIGTLNRPAGSVFTVSDYRKAVILPGEVLVAKRAGSIEVYLKSQDGRKNAKTYAQKTVTIKP
jgi:hypothetical protein